VVELASNSAELIEKMVERDFQDMAGIAALRKDFPVMYSGFRRVWNQRLAMLNRLKLGSDSPFKSSDLGKQGPGMVLDDLRNLIEEAYWFLQSYRTSYLDDADLPPRLRKGIKSLHDLDRHTCLDWARRMAEYEIWKYGHSILPFFVNSKSATKRNLNKKKAKLLNIGTKLPPQNPSKADLTKLLVAKIRDRLKDIL
jgi:hypothetical protein